MNRNFRLWLLSGLAVFLLLGCQKDDNTTRDKLLNAVYAPNARLKRVLNYESQTSRLPASIVAEYEYDSAGRVGRVTHPFYKDGAVSEILSYDKYEYNVNGLLEKIKLYSLTDKSEFVNLKNTSYYYRDDGRKRKEFSEYPLIGSFEYALYSYDKNNLSRVDFYDHQDSLRNYLLKQYDKEGQLVKETMYSAGNTMVYYTLHSYQGGVNVKSDVYGGADLQHIREIRREFDINKNLVALQSKELSWYSSQSGFVYRYEYY